MARIYYRLYNICMYSVHCTLYTDKKEKKIFLIYREIQMASGAKSYFRKGFLILYIYEEVRKYLVIQYMRRPLVIYDFATDPV